MKPLSSVGRGPTTNFLGYKFRNHEELSIALFLHISVQNFTVMQTFGVQVLNKKKTVFFPKGFNINKVTNQF